MTKSEMKTATFIKTLSKNFQGNARLYKLSEPLAQDRWWNESESEDTPSYNYVVVSAANVPYSGPETYIFGATKDGDVLDWGELPGSFRGSRDHQAALVGAGYTVFE